MRAKIFTLFAAFLLFVASAWADGPFRIHRYDAFKVLRVTPENIVFVGNSITNMNEWWESFGSNHKILNRGVSGAVSDEVLANLESILVGHPKKIFLMIGTNDLATPGINTPEHVITNVTTFIDRVKNESPSTEIYIQGILPSTNRRDPATIKVTNEGIKKVCDEKKVTYVDLWEKLWSITNSWEHTLDHLHLSATGYQIWCKEIEKYVGTNNSYPDHFTNQTAGLNYSWGMRSSSFGAYGVKDGDVLIIGDELVHGGEWHELLDNPKVKDRGTGWGYTGATIAQLKVEVPIILKGRSDNGKPAQIYLYAGVQDVNDTKNDLDALAGQYADLLAEVKKNAPGVPVYLISLIPRMNQANTTRAQQFNDKIKAIADTAQNVSYVDIFTPLVKNGAADQTYIKQEYLYGLGYVRVANVLAKTITGCQPITEAEAQERIAMIEARNALGTAVSQAATFKVGDGVGQYSAGSVGNLTKLYAEANALLAKENASNGEITAKAAELRSAIAAVLPNINRPKVSNGTDETWYQLHTPMRSDLYMTDMGAGTVAYGKAKHNYASGMWKFVRRADGSLNIVNRSTHAFLSPASAANSGIKTADREPEAGWEVSYAATPGYYIIHSGTVQLNQTGQPQSNAIYNWSGDGKGTDRTDAGCQFAFIEAGDPDIAPEPANNGEYVVSKSQGTFEGNGNFHNVWKSNATTPQLRLTSYGPDNNTANNMTYTGDDIQAYPGSAAAKKSTYILSVPDPYIISGCEFDFQLSAAATQTLTIDGKTYTAKTGEAQHVAVTGQSGNTMSFVISGDNKGLNLRNFKVTVTLPTGISAVTDVTEAPGIHLDLSGRRVANPTKGTLYIVNGKKVFVR